MSAPADMAWFLDPIDTLTTQYSDLFLQTGKEELASLAVIVLIFYAFKHGLYGGLMQFLTQYGLMVLIAADLLRYYITPLPFPGTPFSVHQAFQVLATGLADDIDLKRMDLMFSNIATILHHLEKPGFTDMTMIPLYWIVNILMWIIEGAVWAVQALSFIALGIGNLLGPLLIPWMIVPKMSYLFWNWIQFSLQYSFYRVGAAALVFIGSTALNQFFVRSLHTTVCGSDNSCYDLAQFAVIMPKMLVLVLALIVGILKLGSMMSDLFKGSASAGANMAGTLAGIKRGHLH